MFPQPPLYISDDLSTGFSRYKKRQEWLVSQCCGPIVIMAPTYGPNQQYTWAHCYQPVYQDSYFLYLTGINQTGIAIVFDPSTKERHIFLPDHDPNHVFWNGHYFSFGDTNSHSFLSQLGFSHICSMSSFKSTLKGMGSPSTTWHLLLDQDGKKLRRNESFSLKQYLARQCGPSFKYENISGLSWNQRLCHDAASVDCITLAAKKTKIAFESTLQFPFDSEVSLTGQLIGQLLKETPFGLSFSPIVAGNANAAILHYSNNSAPLQPHDLVLLDFGLRWQSMCTDVSRTIPVGGQYTDLQRRLMAIVLNTQSATIEKATEHITFDELNDFAWSTLESLLEKDFLSKGGKMKRPYSKQPHNIGHLLGIQVHDGDSNRNYRTTPLPKNTIITIEPGLYGEFELNGDSIHCGIRIEDNVLITKKGHQNLTQTIPKTCAEIEALCRSYS